MVEGGGGGGGRIRSIVVRAFSLFSSLLSPSSAPRPQGKPNKQPIGDDLRDGPVEEQRGAHPRLKPGGLQLERAPMRLLI